MPNCRVLDVLLISPEFDGHNAFSTVSNPAIMFGLYPIFEAWRRRVQRGNCRPVQAMVIDLPSITSEELKMCGGGGGV